jgi:hypothetical protein
MLMDLFPDHYKRMHDREKLMGTTPASPPSSSSLSSSSSGEHLPTPAELFEEHFHPKLLEENTKLYLHADSRQYWMADAELPGGLLRPPQGSREDYDILHHIFDDGKEALVDLLLLGRASICVFGHDFKHSSFAAFAVLLSEQCRVTGRVISIEPATGKCIWHRTDREPFLPDFEHEYDDCKKNLYDRKSCPALAGKPVPMH